MPEGQQGAPFGPRSDLKKAESARSHREVEQLILADPDPIVALMVYLYDTIPLGSPQQTDQTLEDPAR